MKKRLQISLAIALFIHVLYAIATMEIYNVFSRNSGNKNLHKEKRVKISLNEYKPKKKKKKEFGETKTKAEKYPTLPRGSQLNKLAKRPPVRYEPKKPVKKPKLNPKPKPKVVKQKPKPQPKVEPLPPQKPYIALSKPKKDFNTTKQQKIEKKPDNPLYALLSEDKSAEEQQQKKRKSTAGSNVGQNIKELYGDEFGKLTPGQQKYILDNQEIMRRITQRVLTRVARVNLPRDLSVNKTNVIEFYLHPNGDMSDFRFIKKSGYYVLDDTTKETIEYAYSRYPRPSEKTLIRYNVFYNLARY
jgi:outer membrane biosynthesis protein TonB